MRLVWGFVPYEIDWEQFSHLSDAEQQEVAELLRRVEDGSERNPLWFFEPYPKQAEFLASRARFKWMLGGNRAGKTTVCTVDDLIQACDREAVPPHLRRFKKWEPPFKWRVVGQNLDQVEAVIQNDFRQWVPKGQLQGGSWDKAYNKERRTLHFRNGSWCQFKTYEQEAPTHAGVKLHRVRFDEEPPQDIYNENAVRLIDYGGDIVWGMTPVEGLTWCYDRFFVPWERGMLRDAFVQLVDMDDNPHLDSQSKAAALSIYSTEERVARKTGKFVHFHGLVFPEFDERHLIPQMSEVPRGVPVYAGIDPGIRHMAAVVFAYLTPQDELVVFDHLALKDRNVQEVCREIHLMCGHYSIRPEWFVIDPSAQNRMHNTGRSLQWEFGEHGVPTFAGQNNVMAGISAVKVRLEHDKLLVTANCRELIQEFRQYRWVKPPRKSDTDAREAPIKKDDHLLDALRYLVMAKPYSKSYDTAGPAPVDPFERAVWEELNGRRKPALPAQFY